MGALEQGFMSTRVIELGGNMKADGNQENGEQTEEDSCVDDNGGTTRLEVSDLNKTVSSRQLEQKPWCQQHEQYHCYKQWSPINHHFFSFLTNYDKTLER